MAAVATLALPGTSAGADGHVHSNTAMPPDVTLKVFSSSAETWVGRGVVYVVLASNAGGADAASVGVDAIIGGSAAAAATAVDVTGASCSIAKPTQVTCSIDALARASAARIRVQVRPALPGSIEFSSTASAPGDANIANNTAAATTVSRPGRPGPPTVRAGRSPDGATLDQRDKRAASLKGMIDVSEPGQLSLKVVDRRSAVSLPVLVGSSIGSTKMRVRQTTVTVPVGEPKTTGLIRVIYDLRLPLAKLRPKRTYAIVVRVVDLEDQQGNTLQIPFKLSEPTPEER